MADLIRLLDDACNAMIAGDSQGCESFLERFRARVEHESLDAAARAECGRRLERLRGLAGAAAEGLDASRDWLRELSAVLGGLDVYDRSGRQRVVTDLPARAERF
ncbi:hypothetical protein [Paracoccus alkenifer]|uniref:Uncharacterized protein n=1 Tax=Paracoccus alkenifer TaxID=65735 RepID=A0A1H6K154_9RHOB|nr:hypothetical protein [Paracoccus alkenifer]SEH65115.1 hypothetical protein SAMN04488075_0585 [Paracoccus alkenifer]